MPRGPRNSIDNGVYHVINRGNAKQTVFHEVEDFLVYIAFIKRYKEEYNFNFKLYHYVLMPNHIHLLMQIIKKVDLSKVMQGLTLSYSRWHHQKYDKVGYLWQGRFKSMLIEEDVYLMNCGRYIERNPVRAGLVKDPKDYPWSSYRTYAFGEENSLLDIDPLYESLAENASLRQKSYREYVLSANDSELKEVLKFQDGGILGREQFRRNIEESLKMARRPRPGRPKKKVNA